MVDGKVRVALYSFGKCHTIEKYCQVIRIFNEMIFTPSRRSQFSPCILVDGTGIADKDLKLEYPAMDMIDLRDHDINSLNLDAIFVIDPYSRPHVPYRDIKVPIIYKEYGVAGVEAGTGYLLNRSVYKYASLVITETEFSKKMIKDKYPDKEVLVGSPAFDYIYDKKKEDSRFDPKYVHILWTPHHSIESKPSFDLIEGGTYSTFVTYKDYLTGKFLRDNPHVVLHIKSHPILAKRYNAYCKAHGIDDTYKRFIIRSVRDNPRIYLHDGEDYHHLFQNCNIILNDSISFTLEWLPTMKPMIVLGDSHKSAYSSFGESLIDSCYSRCKSLEDFPEVYKHCDEECFDKSKKRLEIFDSLWLSRPFRADEEGTVYYDNTSALVNIIWSRFGGLDNGT